MTETYCNGSWKLALSSQLVFCNATVSSPLNEGPGRLEVWPLGSEGSHQKRDTRVIVLFPFDEHVGEPFSAPSLAAVTMEQKCLFLLVS